MVLWIQCRYVWKGEVMNKKKIAVFASGWAPDIVHKVTDGIKEGFPEGYADIYLFLTYATYVDTPDNQKADLNIFNLPIMEDFDGAVILCNTLDFEGLNDQIIARAFSAFIPVVTIGKTDSGTYFVKTDNYKAMHALCEHLVSEHSVKKPFFMEGTPENADSNIRLKALKDVMSEHGLPFGDDSVFTTKWEPERARIFLKEMIESGKELPDAFLCANDILAMNVCDELSKHDIKVPEEIIVTGFDNDFLAQVYDPSIASVDQNFKQTGAECAKLFMDLDKGIEREDEIDVDCIFLPSESCGCFEARDFEAVRRIEGKKKYLDVFKDSLFDRDLSAMERKIIGGGSYSEIGERLTEMYRDSTTLEDKYTYMLLDPMFEKTILNADRKLKNTGHARIMNIIFGMKDGEFEHGGEFETKDLAPNRYVDNLTHVYVFLSMYETSGNYGYIVTCDNYEKVDDYQFQKYISRINSAFEKFRQNLSLSALNAKLMELLEQKEKESQHL